MANLNDHEALDAFLQQYLLRVERIIEQFGRRLRVFLLEEDREEVAKMFTHANGDLLNNEQFQNDLTAVMTDKFQARMAVNGNVDALCQQQMNRLSDAIFHNFISEDVQRCNSGGHAVSIEKS